MSFKKNPLSTGELHRLAREQFAHANEQSFSELSPEQVQQLLEDLVVSKIELEIQNAHLSEARSQLELTLNEARELYDFSPVGSFSVDHTGTIVKLNLAGARLLGQERVHLLGSRLDQFFPDAERASLNAMLDLAEKSGDVQHGDLAVRGDGRTPRRVRAEIGPLSHGLGCNVILLDITERSRLELRLLENEERWKFALGASGDCVWDWNVQTGTVDYSPQFEQLYGFSVQELGASLENWSSRIHPDDRQQVMASLQKCLTGQTDSYSNEHRGLTKDGSWKWILARGAVFARAGDGSAVRILGTQVDITDRKVLEETLRTASALHRVVFDALPVKLVVLDRDGRIVQTNSTWDTYVRNNGVPGHCCEAGAEYVGALTAMMGGVQNTVNTALAGIADVIAGSKSGFTLEYSCGAPTETHWFIMKVTPVGAGLGRVVVSHQDVTMLKASELETLRLANFDDLTGALSRRNFFNVAEREWARSVRNRLPLMVLSLDLDHFTVINDLHGHAAGDAALAACVKAVNKVLRASDVLGRMGGDEFAVLLPDTTEDGGRVLALRIAEVVASSMAGMGDKDQACTVSIGASCMLKDASFSDLFKRANEALKYAKMQGCDHVAIDTGGTPCLWSGEV